MIIEHVKPHFCTTFSLNHIQDVCIGSASGGPEGLIKTIVNYDGLGENQRDLLDYYIFDVSGNV